MEKKKNIKKSITKSKPNNIKKKNKAFTLIELLAVIIILGILMIIAIPSVTTYISNSRKQAYVNTAKELMGSARNIVNEGKLDMFDTNATYYLSSDCISTENGAVSPYGEFTTAYVVVVYNGDGYSYYWTSVDSSGQGIKNIIKYDNLNSDQLESNLKDEDITTTRGIDGRSKIVIIEKANNCKGRVSDPATENVNGDTGETFVGIPSCPSCMFIYKLDSEKMYMTTWNWYHGGYSPTIVSHNELKEDYREVIRESGKNYFLGFRLDQDNKIPHAYACGIKEGIPFCLEGVDYNSPSVIDNNRQFLQQLWRNTCYERDGAGTLYCPPGEDGLYAEEISGMVTIGVAELKLCRVQNNGGVYCYDYPDGYFSD